MSKLSRETEALLERGRAGMQLTAAHQERLRRAILAKATGAAVVTTTASAAGWMSLGAKIGGALVIVAAVTGAAIEAGVSNRPPTSSTTLASSSGADHATPASWRSSMQIPTTTSSAATPQTAASIAAPASASTATHRAVQLWRAPEARATSTPTPTPTSISRGTASSVAAASPVAAANPSSDVPMQGGLPASSPTASLERDVRLLRDANLAIKAGDPERALDLLDEHAAAFPRSDLEPERSAERVFALCRAGRLEESRTATDKFLRAHPTGPLAARVKSACR